MRMNVSKRTKGKKKYIYISFTQENHQKCKQVEHNLLKRKKKETHTTEIKPQYSTFFRHLTKYPYKNAPVNGAWEWQDLPPDWQEEICWLDGEINPTGSWDWSALEEDWAEKMNYTLLWREYWSANYAGWYGWPLSWNKWDPTKPHRLPEPPNYSILLEEKACCQTCQQKYVDLNVVLLFDQRFRCKF